MMYVHMCNVSFFSCQCMVKTRLFFFLMRKSKTFGILVKVENVRNLNMRFFGLVRLRML